MMNISSSIKYLLLFLVFSTYLQAKDYYLNANSGSDKNNGRSEGGAWKSLKKVNSKTFKPGDKLLIAAGSEYIGQLELKGSGKEGRPILVDKYGSGPNPIIHGAGLKEYTLLLYNVEYWEVRNIAITNYGGERKAKRRGVIVRAEDFGECHHIVLEGLEIYNVNGVLEKKKGGGSAILWDNKGKNIRTRFVDLQILNNYIHHCERNAINSKGNAMRTNWYPSLGVVIRGNLIENVPGDGIVPIGCDGALIEYNVIRKGLDSMKVGDAAAGIWPWSSDNTLIQFNEVSDHRAKWDGQSYDADFNCIGSTFQYNLSFDNWGGFMLICNNGDKLGQPMNIGTKNTVIKYNMSINDGLRPYKAHNNRFFSPIFHITGPTKNTNIEGNIIIIPKKENTQIENVLIEFGDWGNTYPQTTNFEKNIVRNEEVAESRLGGTKDFRASDNNISKKFNYNKITPLQVLKQIENNKLYKVDKNYKTLLEFIQFRKENQDPRFVIMED